MYSFEEIARQLDISPRTVKLYSDQARRKLRIQTKRGLGQKMVEIGLIPEVQQ